MSETFTEARSSLRKLHAALLAADEDTRWMFGFWVLGLVTMAGAIITEFGWRGAVFVFGFVVWKSADHASKK